MEKELVHGKEIYGVLFEKLKRHKKKIFIAILFGLLSFIIFIVLVGILLFQLIISPILNNLSSNPQSLQSIISEGAIIEDIRNAAPNFTQNPTQFIESEIKNRLPEITPFIESPNKETEQ